MERERERELNENSVSSLNQENEEKRWNYKSKEA